MAYEIYFKNFDFDKFKNLKNWRSLDKLADIIYLDLYGKLDRSAFASIEEAKKAVDEREREKDNILKALIKISEEMEFLGYVGDFVGYLKDVEVESRGNKLEKKLNIELSNISAHFDVAASKDGDQSSSALKILYSNYIYNEYRDMFAEIADKGKSFKSYTGSNAALKPIEDDTDFGKALKAIHREEYATAVSLLFPLVKQGNVDALALMTKALFNSHDGDECIGEIFAWCLEAAEQGNAEAMFFLGKIYHYGDERLGVEADGDKCFSWYIKAAAHGHSEAPSYIVNYESKEVQAMVKEYSKEENTKVSCSGYACVADQDNNNEAMDLEDFIRGFASDPDNKFYVAPNLPAKKIQNFLGKYSYEIDEDLILFYFDESVFGSGDSGVVIDASSININVSFCKDRLVMIHRIVAVEISGFLNKTITLKLSDGEIVSFVLTQSNKGASLLCKAVQRAVDLIA